MCTDETQFSVTDQIFRMNMRDYLQHYYAGGSQMSTGVCVGGKGMGRLRRT